MSASPYQETQGQSRHGQARGFITDVALSVVEPGVNSSVLVFINAVFVLLLITLILILVFLTGFNMHVIIMCLLAVGVLIGINWYIQYNMYQRLCLILGIVYTIGQKKRVQIS